MQVARTFKELRTYQMAREGAQRVFEASKQFPSEERYSLTDQIRRSSRAVKAIPGLRSLQGSIRSDINAIHTEIRDIAFSGMINPVDLLNLPQEKLLADIDRALTCGVNDLALWDVDPAVSPSQLNVFMKDIKNVARNHEREVKFSFIPITWEEMDWEFPKYHKENYAYK